MKHFKHKHIGSAWVCTFPNICISVSS